VPGEAWHTPLRRACAKLLLLALGLFLTLYPASRAAAAEGPAEVTEDPGLGQLIAAGINNARAGGEHALRISARLMRPALGHAREMARLGYFSHSSADGTSCAVRITSAYRARHGRRPRTGETLFWATGPVSATDVVLDWLGSPPHRSILLGRRWDDVAVAVVHVAHAPGVFGGRDVTLVVADFGDR
jgi:uncharacterized protein YkwD